MIEMLIIISTIFTGLLSLLAIEGKMISELATDELRPLLPAVYKYASIYGVPVSVILGVIMQESKAVFRTGAAGERGIMQMMPAAFSDVQRLSDESFQSFSFIDLMNDDVAIKFGVRFLDILRQESPDWKTAIRAYNCCGLNIKSAIRNPEKSIQYFNLVKHQSEKLGLKLPK